MTDQCAADGIACDAPGGCQNEAPETPAPVRYSVRVQTRGRTEWIGTTDPNGKYHQRASYPTLEAAQAALEAVRDYPWNEGATFTIVPTHRRGSTDE